MFCKGKYDWDEFCLVSEMETFVRDKVPSLFELDSRKDRNKVEDDLNNLSLICEPRQQIAAVVEDDSEL